MGNYRGSIRCGACYKTGHNRRTCPEVLKRLQRQLDTYKHATNQTRAQILATKIAKRTGVNPLTGEKLEKRGPTRRCSYCKWKHGAYDDHGLGHTRRTCPTMKQDRIDMQKANGRFRTGMIDTLREVGVGVGALVQINVHGYWPDADKPGETIWGRRDVPMLVVKIDWDALVYTNPDARVVLVQRLDKFGTNDGTETISLPALIDAEGKPLRVNEDGEVQNHTGRPIGMRYQSQSANPSTYTPKLVGPVSPGKINPPANWFNGASRSFVNVFDSRKG